MFGQKTLVVTCNDCFKKFYTFFDSTEAIAPCLYCELYVCKNCLPKHLEKYHPEEPENVQD